MNKHKAQPVKIENIVWDVLRKRGYENVIKEQQVIQQWKEIVGEKIAEQTEPAAIENKQMFVKTSNSSWRNELIYLKTEIIKKINEFAGKRVVKDIIFISKK